MFLDKSIVMTRPNIETFVYKRFTGHICMKCCIEIQYPSSKYISNSNHIHAYMYSTSLPITGQYGSNKNDHMALVKTPTIHRGFVQWRHDLVRTTFCARKSAKKSNLCSTGGRLYTSFNNAFAVCGHNNEANVIVYDRTQM